MGKTWIALFVTALLCLPQAAVAWGGGGGGGGASPRFTTTKKTYTGPRTPAPPPEQRHVVSSVSYYVQFKSNEEGWFPIADPRAEDRELLLKASYAPEVKKISDTKFEVFGNFKGKVEGQEETVPVVVHFWLEGKDEKWKVKKTQLHSVNGSEV